MHSTAGQANCKQLQEELARVKEDLEAANSKLKEKSLLISRLEEDIASAHRAGPPPSMDDQSTFSSGNDDITSVTEIIRSQRYQPYFRLTYPQTNTTIISDRFKLRVNELESEAHKLRDQLADVQEEIHSLRTDNLKLYQKIRYLSSYNPRPGSTVDPEDPSELKYKNLYEDSVNPFTIFNRKVRISPCPF